MDKVLIIGFGDVGRRLAAACRRQGSDITAVTRHRDWSRVGAGGERLVFGDLDQPETLADLPTTGNIVFYLAPPPSGGEGDPRMAAFLTAADRAPPRRLVYISTSGVYGDRGGAWVTEADPPRPDTARARRRWAAEQALDDWSLRHGVPVVILRVGGIYGPGRLPLERLRRGLPVLAEAECGYTNRIHVDDLVTILLAAGVRGSGRYNVCDGQPGTMTGYFKAVAARVGLPIPPEVPMAEAVTALSPAMLSYLTESRRLDNRRLREELGITLRYPDLDSGLVAIDPEAELARETASD